jgi:hypothetical protein
MDDKFRKILERALHPTTVEGEWDSAFRAARRMVGASSLDKLLGAKSEPKVREVIRERVVYREPRYTHVRELTFKIAARWQHSFIETIWKDAQSGGLKIEIVHLRGRDKTINSGLDMQVKVYGGPNGLKWWEKRVDGYLEEMNSKDLQQRRASPGIDVTSEQVPIKPGFWTRLMQAITG